MCARPRCKAAVKVRSHSTSSLVSDKNDARISSLSLDAAAATFSTTHADHTGSARVLQNYPPILRRLAKNPFNDCNHREYDKVITGIAAICMYVCMYVCIVIIYKYYSRIWINRVRLPILLVVSLRGKNEYFPVPVRA